MLHEDGDRRGGCIHGSFNSVCRMAFIVSPLPFCYRSLNAKKARCLAMLRASIPPKIRRLEALDLTGFDFPFVPYYRNILDL